MVYIVAGQNLVGYVEVARIEEVFDEAQDDSLVIFDVSVSYTRRAREANLVYCSIQASWTLPVRPLRCFFLEMAVFSLSWSGVLQRL